MTIRDAAHTAFTDSTDTRTYGSKPAVRYDLDLAELFRLLLLRRRWIIGVVGAVSIMAVLVMLGTPNRYTSRATILPSGKSGNLSALRAMAGLAGGLGMQDENSSTLYPVILQSNLVRDSLLAKTYRFNFDGEPLLTDLATYLGTYDTDRLRRALSGLTSISANSRTGELTVAVETEYPEFSQALVDEYLTQLENFNLHSRRSEAGERVRYLTRELEERKAALEAAEDSVEAFQSRHRNWATTTNPVLLKDLARLKREAEARTRTYAYLLQEYEIAKLDAQKDEPIVRILDRASLPTQKSGPYRTIAVLAAAAISFGGVILVIFAFDLLKKTTSQGDRQTGELLVREVQAAFPRTTRWAADLSRKMERETISVDS